jgi:hypothetical protein
MYPASLAGVPVRVVAPVASAVVCVVALVESFSVRHAVGLALKVMWLFFVTGSRG